MKRLISGIVIGALGLFAYQRANRPEAAPGPAPAPEAMREEAPANFAVEASAPAPTFQCDGRTRCTEMRSCEEATFFLQNCPGVKMDGNNDGVPCEQQWCNR